MMSSRLFKTLLLQYLTVILLALSVLSADPGDGECDASLGNCRSGEDPLSFSHIVTPDDIWYPLERHNKMLLDSARNDAYEAAIRRAVESRGVEAQVLDIGSGTGLLTMLAARANRGPHRVVGVERHPATYKLANRILADNDLQDKVVYIRGRSDVLSVEDACNNYMTTSQRPCMPFRANILVSETLGNELFGEGWDIVLDDARMRLITNDALVIPRRGKAQAQAIYYSDGLAIKGFNYNALDPPEDLSGKYKFHSQLELCTLCVNMTDVVDMDAWDFGVDSPNIEHSKKVVSTAVKRHGVVNAIALWWEVQVLDGSEVDGGEDIWLNTGPGKTHWDQYVFMLGREITVHETDTLMLGLSTMPRGGDTWFMAASLQGSPESSLSFTNESPEEVKVYWVEPSGPEHTIEHLKLVLKPEEIRLISTYVGHVFVLRVKEEGEPLAEVQAGEVLSSVKVRRDLKMEVVL